MKKLIAIATASAALLAITPAIASAHVHQGISPVGSGHVCAAPTFGAVSAGPAMSCALARNVTVQTVENHELYSGVRFSFNSWVSTTPDTGYHLNASVAGEHGRTVVTCSVSGRPGSWIRFTTSGDFS